MIIEIPVGKTRYKISCEEAEQEKLINLAERLNHRVDKLSQHIKNADEKTLLVIAALMIEEELEHQKQSEIEEDATRNESPSLNDQDVYDAVSENMENIADHIEKLTQKIQSY